MQRWRKAWRPDRVGIKRGPFLSACARARMCASVRARAYSDAAEASAVGPRVPFRIVADVSTPIEMGASAPIEIGASAPIAKVPTVQQTRQTVETRHARTRRYSAGGRALWGRVLCGLSQ